MAKVKLSKMQPKPKKASTKKASRSAKKGDHKHLSFVTKTIELIRNSDESFEDIGYNCGVSFQTVRRLSLNQTPNPDANTVQTIYEYLSECELQF